ncbi:MAG: hypothetical protein FWF78_08355 [Defluviitaleaceae bacterium]|nr:hypothetical protein [Defluviitaleaceae bacterium]
MVVVANTSKTIIRIAHSSVVNWETIKANFPIGEKINENTYVFDGSIFKKGQTRLFLAALPFYVCDELAKEAAKRAGGVHKVKRIETAEHLLFRKYCESPDSDMYIFLPQDVGIRVLHLLDNLPNAAHYISNNPNHRESEFMRIYDKSTKHAVLLDDGMDLDWLLPFFDNAKIIPISQPL